MFRSFVEISASRFYNHQPPRRKAEFQPVPNTMAQAGKIQNTRLRIPKFHFKDAVGMYGDRITGIQERNIEIEIS